MLMHEVPKGTGDHHIAKVAMGPQHVNPARMLPERTKVAAAKRHRLPFADQSGHHPVNRFFRCITGRCDMQIDTQRKEKAPLNRRINPCS
jgi:hypothetical protein